MKNDNITINGLSESRTFRSRRELEEFVAELEATRFGVYTEFERRCRAYVHSGSTSFVFPPEVPRPPRAATSRDDDLAAADAQVAERQAEYEAALERRWAITDQARREFLRALHDGRRDVSALRAKLGERVRAAEVDSLRAGERLRRAKAARNAIAAAAQEEGRRQTARYHNPEDPSQPLTEDELREVIRERVLLE